MKNIYKIIILIVISFVIVFFVFAKPYRISGDCMEPAIKDGQLYFLNKATPYFRSYKIDDIIVFKHEDKDWIARIVALENNTIQIIEGNVIVNNIALDQKEIHRNWSGWQYGTFALNEPFQVPKDHVFVLSDNLSAQHDDSRVFGPIPRSSILGLIW
ncbi:MAG: signal peptidase I [Alphaproteobacteria bacterium]|nr:signal peptidase I [Alphaproteobacteria bacterium]